MNKHLVKSYTTIYSSHYLFSLQKNEELFSYGKTK